MSKLDEKILVDLADWVSTTLFYQHGTNARNELTIFYLTLSNMTEKETVPVNENRLRQIILREIDHVKDKVVKERLQRYVEMDHKYIITGTHAFFKAREVLGFTYLPYTHPLTLVRELWLVGLLKWRIVTAAHPLPELSHDNPMTEENTVSH